MSEIFYGRAFLLLMALATIIGGLVSAHVKRRQQSKQPPPPSSP